MFDSSGGETAPVGESNHDHPSRKVVFFQKRRNAYIGLAFPDQQLKVVHLIAEDNLVAFWATYSATQEGPIGPFPVTGNEMDIAFSGFHRIDDGKIAETWVTSHNLAALTELGL